MPDIIVILFDYLNIYKTFDLISPESWHTYTLSNFQTAEMLGFVSQRTMR